VNEEKGRHDMISL